MNLFVWNRDDSCTCWGWLGMAVNVAVYGRAMYCVMLIELWHHSIVWQKCMALTIISKINISLILIRALQTKLTEITCLVWSSRRSTEGQRAGRWGTSSLCSETKRSVLVPTGWTKLCRHQQFPFSLRAQSIQAPEWLW